MIAAITAVKGDDRPQLRDGDVPVEPPPPGSSSRAASKSTFGTDNRRAKQHTIAKLTCCHTMIAAMVPRARLESPSQSWRSAPSPTAPKISLTGPYLVRRFENTTPITVGDSTNGMRSRTEQFLPSPLLVEQSGKQEPQYRHHGHADHEFRCMPNSPRERPDRRRRSGKSAHPVLAEGSEALLVASGTRRYSG